MSEGQFNSGLRSRLPQATIPCALLVLLISSTASFADVEVDLSAIGLRTETDERIAPGRAPVQLRLPSSSSETRILLTPPPGVSRTERAPAPTPAPVVLAPASSQTLPVLPIVRAPASPPERPELQTRPVEQAALPTTSNISPSPVEPVDRAPVQAPELDNPTPAATIPAETQATPVPSGTQVASLPTPNSASHHLRFDADVATIPGQTRSELILVAAELMRHSDRIEIQAYAGPASGLTSDARRLSLQRGLAVRKFLVEQGVLQSRIDVRALGGVRDNGPTERVDIILSSR